DNFADRNNIELSQRILWIDHHHELIAKDGMRLQAGGLDRQSHDSHVDGAVLQFLHNFVTEITVDADLYSRIEMAKLGENIRQNVQAGRFVGADHKSTARSAALISHRKQGFVAQLQ